MPLTLLTVLYPSSPNRTPDPNPNPNPNPVHPNRAGAPEAVFYLFGFPMKKGEEITHLTTLPPSRRRRALTARPKPTEDAGNEEELSLRFADGAIEQYNNRPTDLTDAERAERVYDPGAPPTVLEADAAVVHWVQCEECGKWRVRPTGSPAPLGEWTCAMNTDPLRNICDAAEQDEDDVAMTNTARGARGCSDIKWNDMLYPDFHRNFVVRCPYTHSLTPHHTQTQPCSSSTAAPPPPTPPPSPSPSSPPPPSPPPRRPRRRRTRRAALAARAAALAANRAL